MKQIVPPHPDPSGNTPSGQTTVATAPSQFELVPDGEFPETQAEASRELQLVLDPEFL